MTPIAIIRLAHADGVSLVLSSAEIIKAIGDGVAVYRWLPMIRKHKAEIVDILKGAAIDTTPGTSGWSVVASRIDPETASRVRPKTHPEIRKSDQEMVEPERLTPNPLQAHARLDAEDEAAIHPWLEAIDETAPTMVGDVPECCPQDANARTYFVGRAAVKLWQRDPFPDDRRACAQCANLLVGRCQAAKRGEIVASRTYAPIRNMPRRCEGYAPGAGDADRRLGRERWPWLIQERDE